MSATEHIGAAAEILGIEIEELGGGLKGFTFNLQDGKCLVFSHSDNALGYALDSADGINLKWECMEDEDAGAEEQAEYIRKVCSEHGVKDLAD